MSSPGYVALRIPLDVALNKAPYDLPGGATHLSVLHDPGMAAALEIRVGSVLSDPITIGGSVTFTACEPIDKIFVTSAAVAGGFLELGIGIGAQVQGACVEICDNEDRLLGHVTIDPPVTGVAVDLLDDATRLLGIVASITATVATDQVGSATLTAGSGTAPATAAAIGASLAIKEILVQCLPTSPASLSVGSSAAQPIVLVAGAALAVAVDNRNKLYVQSAGANATYGYVARG